MQALIVNFLINQAIAWLMRWLDQNHPTQVLRSKPAPIVKAKPGKPRKYAPVSTAPGTWNRAEGRWNT